MPKITPFLWFDNQAADAAKFYVSVFKDSQVLKSTPMIVQFTLDGEPFTALNGGPRFKFTEAVSFVVDCKSQEEVDYYWSKLTADGGQEGQCGWLKDKYGLSWQIVPDALSRFLSDPDRDKSKRAMEAMLKMKKIDIAELQRARDHA